MDLKKEFYMTNGLNMDSLFKNNTTVILMHDICLYMLNAN